MSTVITTNQIFDILNAALEQTQSDENYHVNILLTGNDGSGRTNVVRRWFERKAIRYYEFTNPGLGAIAGNDVLNTLDVGPFGVILRKVNSSALDPEFDTVSKLIETRQFNNGDSFDFGNLKFAVATISPEDDMHSTVALPDEFLDKFDVYVVEPSLKETLEYLDGWYEKKSNNITRLKVKSVQGGRELEKITAYRIAQKKKLIDDVVAAMGDKDFVLGATFTPKKLENVFENNNFDTVEEFRKAVVMEMKMAKQAAPENDQQLFDDDIAKFKSLFE